MRNLEDEHLWEQEQWVPRERGTRIVKAIMYMLSAPNYNDMLQRKATIDSEIARQFIKEKK